MNKPDPCKLAHLVQEHIISHDEPYNYRETLEYFFRDAIAGVSFEGANGQRRSEMYTHYCQLQEFLQALEKM